MENRLCLNKVPTFELPEGIEVVELGHNGFKQGERESMKPTPYRLSKRGATVGLWLEDKELTNEYWFYCSEKDFEKIKKIDFRGMALLVNTGNSPGLPIWRLKKAIKEDFYGTPNINQNL